MRRARVLRRIFEVGGDVIGPLLLGLRISLLNEFGVASQKVPWAESLPALTLERLVFCVRHLVSLEVLKSSE
jgi:hypothetical protein